VALGIDPEETIKNSIFEGASVGGNPAGLNTPYGYVRVEGWEVYFYTLNAETEAKLATGAQLSDIEPTFRGEFNVDGTDVWLGISNSQYSAMYKLLSK